MENAFDAEKECVFSIQRKLNPDLKRKFEDFFGRTGTKTMPSSRQLDDFILHEYNVARSYQDRDGVQESQRR